MNIINEYLQYPNRNLLRFSTDIIMNFINDHQYPNRNLLPFSSNIIMKLINIFLNNVMSASSNIIIKLYANTKDIT